MKDFRSYLEEIQEIKKTQKMKTRDEFNYGDGKAIFSKTISFKHNDNSYSLKTHKKQSSWKYSQPPGYDGPDEIENEDEDETEGKRKITTLQLFKDKKSLGISKDNEDLKVFLKKYISDITDNEVETLRKQIE